MRKSEFFTFLAEHIVAIHILQGNVCEASKYIAPLPSDNQGGIYTK